MAEVPAVREPTEHQRVKSAARLILSRRMARAHIRDYIKYMRPSNLLAFAHNPQPHHELIIDLLEELADPDKELDQGAMSLPPNSAKSTYSSVQFPTWLLARNPKLRIMCIGNTEKLASEFSAQRRQILRSKEWESLSQTKLSAERQSLDFQQTEAGGFIQAVGAGTSISGRRADILIGDDLITGLEQAMSLDQLDKLWQWYLSEARTRLEPSTGIELLIGTRWHTQDPIGRVVHLTTRGQEDWRYLRVPLIADDDNDPLGRESGHVLWKTRYTPRFIRNAKRDPQLFQTQYQQLPAVAEHAWVGPENIQLLDSSKFPTLLKRFIGCDISLGVSGGDWTVFVVVGVSEDRTLFVEHMYRTQASPDETARALVGLVERYEPSLCMIDNDNFSRNWLYVLAEEGKKQGIHIPMRESKMGGKSKEGRATQLRAAFLSSAVVIADEKWAQVMMREIASFPQGRHDDVIDALALVAREMPRLSAPKPEPEDVRPTKIKTNMILGLNGQVTTSVCLNEMFSDLKKQKRFHRNRI